MLTRLKSDMYVYNVLLLFFNCLLILSLHFPSLSTEKVFLPFLQNTVNSTTRLLGNSNKQIRSLNATDKWKTVIHFKQDGMSLYQSKETPDILISLRKGEGLAIKQISDLNGFFNKTEEIKQVSFLNSSIKNRKVSLSQIESSSHTVLFYTKGTYIDFQKKTVFFEDFSFYHNKLSLYIVIHNTQTSTTKETQTIYSFLESIILSETSLTNKEQEEFFSLIETIKNEAN